jgi:hypothetical protein
MTVGVGILACVRAVDGRHIFIGGNANSFAPGMLISVRRNIDTEIGTSEINRITTWSDGRGSLTLWPKVDVRPGDLLLFGGWTPEESN